jgi:hypothetical protein
MASPFSTITIPNNVSIIPVDTRGNNLKVLYLPTVSTNQGRFLLFKDYYGTASNSSFTLSTTGTDLIDDYNCLLSFSNAFGSVSLLADGASAWRTIGMYDGLATPAAPSTGLDLNTIAGLIVWSDATVHTSAQTLTTWTNKATVGTHTTTCSGTVVLNGLNSLPVVRFTTSAKWRVSPDVNMNAYTMFWVGRQRGGTNARVLNSLNNHLYGYWNGGKQRLYTDGDPNQLGGLGSDSIWDMFSHSRATSAPYTFNWNGTSIYSAASSTGNNMNGLTINDGAYGEYSDCEAAEIVLYNVVLSTVNIQKIEGYLAWKWGLQANLPSGHPYKSASP